MEHVVNKKNTHTHTYTMSGLELWVFNILHMPAESRPSKQPTILIGEQGGGPQSRS